MALLKQINKILSQTIGQFLFYHISLSTFKKGQVQVFLLFKLFETIYTLQIREFGG